jgi:hypothetical protein
MSNKEIIEKLKEEGIIYAVDDIWVVEYYGGAEMIGDVGFTEEDICRMYRKQMGL